MTVEIAQNLGTDIVNAEAKLTTSLADSLLKLAKENGLFFQDQFGTAYGFVKIKEHSEVIPVNSKKFRNFLLNLYHKKYKKTVSATPVKTAIDFCEAEAFGTVYELDNRVCKRDSSIFYDLANSQWEVVKIDKSGWRVATPKKPIFTRYAHQKEQVYSNEYSSGNIDKMLSLFDLDADNKLLVKVFIVSGFIPDIPRAFLIFFGPQGSGKSVLAGSSRDIIDPSTLKTIDPPLNKNELAHTLQHHYYTPFDNMSYMSREVSDALCRASTGAGTSTRKLYTDNEDFISSYRRLVSLNGINNVAFNADLLDRSIIISMNRINPTKRKTEDEIKQFFDELKPEIVTECFEVVSRAMNEYENISLERIPRMADFVKWGEAIARVMGHKPMEFVNAFERNAKGMTSEIIGNTPVGSAVVDFVEDNEEWIGTAEELLSELNEKNTLEKQKSKGWPGNGSALSRALGNLKATLEDVGIGINRDYKHTGARKEIRLWKINGKKKESVGLERFMLENDKEWS
ncbi:MAG: hypothetical protein COV47_05855 [Candidatus Diapherotrites archaeon CG11_big_fil_rev_8_21_14_0_20_37_9]|nr:MAG: hypothetical protein COV47_05855 [Candidatus Diapherotrites archaeon CG11_big_fil_rev_8_21_14_0_20_37_9]